MEIEYRTEPEFIEYLDGEAHPKVSPRVRHGTTQARIVSLFEQTAAGRGIIAVEGDAAIGKLDGTQTKLIPDVSFFYPDRFAGLSYDDQDEPPFSPDIAIEVRSRGDAPAYVRRKIARYLETGARLVLDVDFRARTIDAYTTAGHTHFTQDERFANEPFPWFTFTVRDVFSVLDGLPDWVE
ncbi:MAG TPA: Uma2 family endonuclease [Candidatus Aquilonibacter sp.]